MVWDVLMQFLGWAVPGGLGAGATWFLSRRQRRTREAKEVHDTYREMYADVSATLSAIQARNNELNDILEDIKQENCGLRRAVVALRKAIQAIGNCRHYDDCPVRRELPLIADCGAELGIERVGHGRHITGNGLGGIGGTRKGGGRRRGHPATDADAGDGGLSSGGRRPGGRKGRLDADGAEVGEGTCGDVEDPPGG